ncbi:MAG: hypothetical protein ACI4I5_03550 [Acutalibacteraceae bacterium]
MNISANGFFDHTLTLQTSSPIPAGHPVKLTDNFTVADTADGDSFCGVLLSCCDGVCAVQLKGAVTLSYSGTAPSVGSASLVCDGNGGVKSAENGTAVLILSVDTTANTVTCIL